MKTKFSELIDAIEKDRKYNPYTLEKTTVEYAKEILNEANEVMQALDNNDNKNLQEELGDVLWDLLMTIHIAEQEKRINSREVINGVIEKFKRRKPYIFEEITPSKEDAKKIWHDAKNKEKK